MDKKPQQEELWYRQGLRFKCTECGKCCTGAPGYVWVDEKEIEQIANHLRLPVDQFKRTYLRIRDGRYSLTEKGSQNYDCIFLQGKLCTVYPVRPKQCRTFPFWKENLRSAESWREAANDCEGINDEAPLISIEEIQKRMR